MSPQSLLQVHPNFLSLSLQGEVLCPSDHLGVPPQDSLPHVHVLPVLGPQGGFRVGSHQSTAESENKNGELAVVHYTLSSAILC